MRVCSGVHHAAARFCCRFAEFIPSCNAGSGLTLSVRMLLRDVGKAVSVGWAVQKL